MATIQVFDTIEELKADRVERKLSSKEVLRQKRATDSLSIFLKKQKITANKKTI